MNRNVSEHHLDLCRKLDQHLRRIEGAIPAKRTESSKRRKTVSINQVQCSACPIDLSHFLDELEAYVNWADENKAMIKAALAAKLAAGGGGSDAA
jgi:methionine aminopeptidase